MRKAKFLVALGLLLVMGATAAQAQAEKKVQLDAFGAFVLPMSDFGDVVKASPGFGAAIGYYVTPAIVISGNFNWGMMKGKDEAGGELADLDLMNIFGTIGYDFMALAPNMSFAVYAGGGMMMFRPKPEGAESYSRPGIDGGLKFNYWFSPSVGLLLQSGVAYAFMKEDEGTVFALPQVVGVSFKF